MGAMSKKKKYPLNKIRRAYTYSVQQIAEMYGIDRHTVLRWIRDDGLRRIEGTKKYHVHGSQLYRFLEQRTLKRKKPCSDNELFCFKCREPSIPKIDTIKIKKIPNKTIRVSGKCEVCNTSMNKVISGKKWNEKHPFYPNKNIPTKQHSGEQESQRKCNRKTGEQICMNLTP